MITEIVQPIISNFIKSLRDIGYTFEVAIADILDNSISANASNVKVMCIPINNEVVFAMLDDGMGMSNEELTEAMRLASSDPDNQRSKEDLGKFGLGLKTASFSQCKELSVLSKKDGVLSIKQWDLEYISKMNDWLLISPNVSEFIKLPFFEELTQMNNGTLVIWRKIDTFTTADIPNKLELIRSHLSLVFHNFIEGVVPGKKALKINVNEIQLTAFNPFNHKHIATQQLIPEKIKYLNSEILVQPFILPHHSKLSKQEYDKYATAEGYTKSQGFYLYRANRLLIYGTWWGMHRTNDAHRLVRIKIDIPNNMDNAWGIDVKKSTASPVSEIKKDLKRIIQQVTIRGSRPYTGRGKKIEDLTTTRFWNLTNVKKDEINFVVNREHPLIKTLINEIDDEQQKRLSVILMGLESYIPIDAIIAQISTDPLKVNQSSLLNETLIKELVNDWKSKGISDELISQLLKTELFKNKEGYFNESD